MNQQDEQRLALFIDFENIAIGVRDAHYRKFDINLVLERLLEKGKLLVKRAYADWSRYSDYKRAFHEAAIELIEVPQKSVGGKNSADIRLVVDAMDMSLQKQHITSFVIASGDSDFSPLVSKLKENDKYVIGLGVKNSTSDLLMDNCDEFIFYEDLVRGQQRQLPVISNLPEKHQEVFGLLVDAILALQRENKEVLWGSMVKETMKRKKPSFNETYYGFRTFSHLLEEAQRKNIVVLRRDQKSGSYVVEDLGSGASAAPAPPSARLEAVPSPASVAAAGSPGPAVAASADTPPESAANGARPARRRRSRSRRGGRAAAAGTAPLEGTVPEEAVDADDFAEGADEEGASEAEHAESGSDHHPDAGHETGDAHHGSDAAAEDRSRAEGGPPREAERPFSLFSWLRREPDPTRREE